MRTRHYYHVYTMPQKFPKLNQETFQKLQKLNNRIGLTQNFRTDVFKYLILSVVLQMLGEFGASEKN